MTQEKGIPYRRHEPSAALRDFLDPLDPGSYFDCGEARLHGLDDALLREAESRGRRIGDDSFQLVATDMGLIFCRPSISFAIAARWQEVMLIRPHGDDPAVLPVNWPTHGELKFTVSKRLAANVFRRWLQLRMQRERVVRRENAARFTAVERTVTSSGDWEVVAKVEAPTAEEESDGSDDRRDRRELHKRRRREPLDDRRPDRLASSAARGPAPAPGQVPVAAESETAGIAPAVPAMNLDDPGPDRVAVGGTLTARRRFGSAPVGSPTLQAPQPPILPSRPRSEPRSPGRTDDAEPQDPNRPEARLQPDPQPENHSSAPPPVPGPSLHEQVLDLTDGRVPAGPPGSPLTSPAVLESTVDQALPDEPRVERELPVVGDPAPRPVEADGGVTLRLRSLRRPVLAGDQRDHGDLGGHGDPAGQRDDGDRGEDVVEEDDELRPVATGVLAQDVNPVVRTIDRPPVTPPSWIGSPISLVGAVVVISTLVLAGATAVTSYRRVVSSGDGSDQALSTAIDLGGTARTTVDHRRFSPLSDPTATVTIDPSPTTNPAASMSVEAADGEPDRPALQQGPRLCNSNYSGCVPDVSDVDCPNDGDGPLYSTEAAVVMGDDVYGLDTDGDGETCEPDQPRHSDLVLGTEPRPADGGPPSAGGGLSSSG